MNIGKLLPILGGILTLFAMYFFTLFAVFADFSYVIGGFTTFSSVIVNTSTHAANLGVGEWVIYLILVAYVIFAITGFIQLGGVRSKLAAIIGSVIPLLVGIILMINGFTGVLHGFRYAMEMFIGPPVNEIYFPIHLELGNLGIGLYLMIVGSLLTFISVFLKREPKEK